MKSFISASGTGRRVIAPGLRPWVGIIALAVAGFSSCGRTKPPTGVQTDPVALKIGEREVSLSELQAEMEFLRKKHNPAVSSREAFLDTSIQRRVALEKARQLGLDQDIELRRQYENLLIGRLKKTELEARLAEVKVTDEEVQNYYEQNLRKYTRPAQVQLALLFLKVPRNSDAASREAIRMRMEEARTKAASLPADTRGFGADAMTYSEEPTSRFKGGDIGWLQEEETSYPWPAAVVEAGFALESISAVSEVISTGDGFYLLKKIDARAAAVRSLDGRMRSTLETALLNEKRALTEKQLIDDWKTSLPVTVHPEVVGKLDFRPLPDQAQETEPLLPEP